MSKVKYTITPALGNPKKKIFVFGDSFAELSGLKKSSETSDNTVFSWINIIAQLLNIELTSFGVGGGTEQWVLESFKRTMHLPRDFTIICHTRIGGRCNFTGRKSLSLNDFRDWNKNIPNETLHIFNLSDHYPFDFTQGYKLNNKYYLIPELSDEYPQLQYFSAHHMNLNGNLLFANDVMRILKNHFKDLNNGT